MDARRLTREMLDGFESNDLLTYASAIAFQILTALVPLLLFLLGLAGWLDLGDIWRADLAPDVKASVSKPVYQVLEDTVNNVLGRKQLFWVTAGFALALWQVSGAVRAVMGALDGIYDSRYRRPAKVRYPVSLALAIAVGALLVAAAAEVRFVPLLVDDQSTLVTVLLFVARWAVAAALMAAVVALLIRFAPDRSRPLPWVTFGTLLVIVGWILMSIGFGLYLTYVASYGSVFGHLATLIVLMAYLYAAAAVFLGGLQLDAIVRREYNSRRRGAGS